MSKSPFFARIREQVLQLTAAVPSGWVCSYASMGEYLDVAPRHVAYILSQLTDQERQVYPWHRVVGADGRLGSPKRHLDGRLQADLLRSEGHELLEGRIHLNSPKWVSATALPSGVARQVRPVSAPRAPSVRKSAAKALRPGRRGGRV
jgi:methylated-DNA-protein-cysteine methyltransferase-like protein